MHGLTRAAPSLLLAAVMFTAATACGYSRMSDSHGKTGGHTSSSSPPSPSETSSVCGSVESYRVTGIASFPNGTALAWGEQGSGFRLFSERPIGCWSSLDTPASPSLYGLNGPAVFFLSPKVGWMAYEDTASIIHVWATTTNGTSWTQVYSSTVTPDMRGGFVGALDFRSPTLGWMEIESSTAMGRTAKVIALTEDGGGTWSDVSVDTGYVPNQGATPNALPEAGGYVSMNFTSSTIGWISMEAGTQGSPVAPGVWESFDAGRDWTFVPFTVPRGVPRQNEYDICQAPQVIGTTMVVPCTFAGETGFVTYVYISADGGKRWAINHGPIPGAFSGFVGGALGEWLLVTAPTGRGLVANITTNGGTSWESSGIDSGISALLQILPDGRALILVSSGTQTSMYLFNPSTLRWSHVDHGPIKQAS